MTEADISTQIACRVCAVSKNIEAYPKSATGKHGRTTRCKSCTGLYLKQYQVSNKEKLKADSKKRYAENREAYRDAGKANYEKNKDAYKGRAKKWVAENPDKRKAVVSKYHFSNLEKRAEGGRESRQNNPGMYRAHFKARQQRKRKAMPAWANEAAIKAIYDACSEISKATGVKHHVDHYYPLKNDYVCGLHNEYNLRIITAFDNLSKGNSLPTEEL